MRRSKVLPINERDDPFVPSNLCYPVSCHRCCDSPCSFAGTIQPLCFEFLRQVCRPHPLTPIAVGSFQIVERQLTDGLQNDCLLCAIESVQVEFEDGDAETFFECHVIYDDDDNVPTDVVFGIPFDIDLPEDFVMEHLVSLLDGATICIPGGEAIRSFNGTDLDIIDIPEDAEITLILEGQEDTGIELNLTSPRKVLVARVIGDSGAEVPVESPNILAGSIFGIGDQPYSNSMRDQYNRCSFGKLDFVPATSAEFPLAVVDVMIEDSLQGQNLYTRRYDYHIALQELLGVNNLQSEYDHVIFCVAAGTVVGGRTRRREWTAFAPRHTFSYYNSKFGRCDKLSALMHEVGHNLGLIHSGNPGDQYGDLTGAVRIPNHTTRLFSIVF